MLFRHITSSEIDFIRRFVLERRMDSPDVVKIHIVLDSKP